VLRISNFVPLGTPATHTPHVLRGWVDRTHANHFLAHATLFGLHL
jgi:hypothetical protein